MTIPDYLEASVARQRKERQMGVEVLPHPNMGVQVYREQMRTITEVESIFDTWGYGGSTTSKNAASPPLIDLDQLNAPRVLWLPGTAGNYVSTPDVNEIDYDSSTFENGVGKWEGLNKNLVTANQSSAETDTTGWYGIGNVSVARSTEQFLTGAASLKATCTATTTGIYPSLAPGTRPSVIPGQVYTGIASIRAATTTRATWVSLSFFDVNNGQVDSEIKGVPLPSGPTGWTQLRVVAQAPANAVTCRVTVGIEGAIATGEAHYIDAVGLFETPNANLILNPDLENSLALTSAYNGATAARSQERTYTGRSSALITWDTNANGRCNWSAGTLTVGQTYTASMRVWVPAGHTPVAMDIGNLSGSATAATTVTGQWVTLVKTFVCNFSGNAPQVGPVGTPTAGHQVYVDSVQLVVGSTAPEYIPPSTVNLLKNPNFGVNPAGGQHTWTTERPYLGTHSVVFTSDSAAYNEKLLVLENTPVFEGDLVTSSAYFYTDTPGIRVFPEWQINGYASPEGETVLPTGVWTRVVRTRKLEAIGGNNPIYATQYVMRFPAGTSGAKVFMDAAQLEYGSVATSYVDGSLGAGYIWEASENLLSAAASSFEDGTTGGWVVSLNADTPTNTIEQAFSGTKALRWATTAAGDTRVRSAGPGAAAVSVVPNTTYTISAYVRCGTTARNSEIAFVTWDTAGTLVRNDPVGTGVAIATTTTGWTRLTRTFITASNETQLSVGVFFIGAAAAEVFYVDAVQLEAKEYPTAFGQVATAHAASSRRQTPWVLGGTTIESTRVIAFNPWQGTKTLFTAYIKSPMPSRVGAGATVTVAPTTQYTWSCYGSGYGGARTMRAVDVATGTVLATGAGPAQAGAYSRASLTFTTLAGTQVRLEVSNAQGDMYLDAVQLERGASASPYTLPLRITGDLDLRAHVALEDWTRTGTNNEQTVLSAWQLNGWLLQVWNNGLLHLAVTDSAGVTTGVDSTAAVPATDGAPLHVRATLDVDNGAAGRTTRFYTSSDGVTWTQLGADVVQADAISLKSQAVSLRSGSRDGTGKPLKGKVLSAEVRAGIDGTVVARYDATQHVAATYTDPQGKVWTINRSGEATAEIVDRNTWAFTGTEYLTLPDRDSLDFGAGEAFTMAVGVLTRSVAANARLLDKRGGATPGYGLYINGGGTRSYAHDTALTEGPTSASPEVFNGNWHLIAGGRLADGTITHRRDDGIEATATPVRPGGLGNAQPLVVGATSLASNTLRGLISWVALFRRTLTTAEHAALAAWDGKVATEPTWLRAAATLYVNADDKQQRLRYEAYNRVVNLAVTAGL